MAYLHDDKAQFQEAIAIAYEQTGIMSQVIEKDYYVTMILRMLSERVSNIVFKGGTSLSKCHKVIKRFSEDIDITIDTVLSQDQKKKSNRLLCGIDRTLIDKVFAICDYYLQGKVQKHSRHIYDIYKLLPLVPLDDTFQVLFEEVRTVRAKSNICLSAQPVINIPNTLEKIIEEKVYKRDYEELTVQLLEEQIPYEEAVTALKRIKCQL